MNNFLYITSEKQLDILDELFNNILTIVKPMKEGSIRERTNRALSNSELGLHDIFIDLPAMWMDSILLRMSDRKKGSTIKISSVEAIVLLELIHFLNENELYVGDVTAVSRILSEISHTDNKDIEL
jgi:hypothetical protein